MRYKPITSYNSKEHTCSEIRTTWITKGWGEIRSRAFTEDSISSAWESTSMSVTTGGQCSSPQIDMEVQIDIVKLQCNPKTWVLWVSALGTSHFTWHCHPQPQNYSTEGIYMLDRVPCSEHKHACTHMGIKYNCSHSMPSTAPQDSSAVYLEFPTGCWRLSGVIRP